MEKANPDGLIVSYVNTTAEVKGLHGLLLHVFQCLENSAKPAERQKDTFRSRQEFGCLYTKSHRKEMEIWNGDCCVHDKIDTQMVLDKLEEYPDADVLIHPESSCSHDDRILNHPRAFMYSTAGIIKHAKESPKQRFIIATELETIHKLQADNPTKEFIPIHPQTICGQMKKVTLEKSTRSP